MLQETIREAEQAAADIPGWGAGIETLYRQTIAILPDGASFVEVGVWQGRSIILAALEARRLGKRLRFYAVDHFRGSEEHQTEPVVAEGRLREAFEDNLIARGVQDVVTVEAGESVEVARSFRDESLEFVFLDASHDYPSVKADIAAWLPKVKMGGTIAGHDFMGWPGVGQAVIEAFGGIDQNLTVEGDCWIHWKTAPSVAAFTPWQHAAIVVPATIDAVAQALDKMGPLGWEYCGKFDTQIQAQAPPPDLTGKGPAPKLSDLAKAQGVAQQTMPGHYLIFKRPKPA